MEFELEPAKRKANTNKIARIRDFTTSAGLDQYWEELALDRYILDGNKTESYKMYVFLTTGRSPKCLTNTVAAFFRYPRRAEYVERRKKQFEQKAFDDFLFKNNISRQKVLGALKSSKIEEAEDEKTREYLREELKSVIESPDTADATRVAAMNSLRDLMDAKMRREESVAGKNLIHFYLPGDICEECPNRSLLEQKYDSEEVEEEEITAEQSEDSTYEEEDESILEEEEYDEDEEEPIEL